ncbi:MAG: hypothetical protein V1808_03690 [Candidatus Daviesbacteria bacterium]
MKDRKSVNEAAQVKINMYALKDSISQDQLLTSNTNKTLKIYIVDPVAEIILASFSRIEALY